MIGCKLVLLTNGKSHTGFPLVPKSVTLNDLERPKGQLFCVTLQNSTVSWVSYAKLVEVRPILSAAKLYRKESSFRQYILYGYIPIRYRKPVPKTDPLSSVHYTTCATWRGHLFNS